MLNNGKYNVKIQVFRKFSVKLQDFQNYGNCKITWISKSIWSNIFALNIVLRVESLFVGTDREFGIAMLGANFNLVALVGLPCQYHNLTWVGGGEVLGRRGVGYL